MLSQHVHRTVTKASHSFRDIAHADNSKANKSIPVASYAHYPPGWPFGSEPQSGNLTGTRCCPMSICIIVRPVKGTQEEQTGGDDSICFCSTCSAGKGWFVFGSKSACWLRFMSGKLWPSQELRRKWSLTFHRVFYDLFLSAIASYKAYLTKLNSFN